MTRMATSKPARKVIASSIGAAVATLVIWCIQIWFGVETPPPVQAAITVIVSFLLGYYVPPAPQDQIA